MTPFSEPLETLTYDTAGPRFQHAGRQDADANVLQALLQFCMKQRGPGAQTERINLGSVALQEREREKGKGKRKRGKKRGLRPPGCGWPQQYPESASDDKTKARARRALSKFKRHESRMHRTGSATHLVCSPI